MPVSKPTSKKTPAKPVVKAPVKAKAPVKTPAKAVPKTAAKPAMKAATAQAPAKSSAKPVAKSAPAKAAPAKPAPKSKAAADIKPAKPADTKPSKTSLKPSATPPEKTSGKPLPRSANLSPQYKPSEKEEYMNSTMLDYFRTQLVRWRQDLLTESNDTLESLSDGGMQEPDITDRATAETDRALEFRTRDRERKLIRKIDEALERIAAGDFGYCEETGEPIGIKRLMARPIATLTVEAQERHERNERTQRDEDDE